MKKILIVSLFYNEVFIYTKPLYEQLQNSYDDKYEFKHIGNYHMTFDLDEIKKTYKATEFISENLGNEYYGDYLKNDLKRM